MKTYIPQNESPRPWRVQRIFTGKRSPEEVLRALIEAHQS